MRVIPPVAITQSGSFTRASTGTYIDTNGYIATQVANVPRFNYNPLDLTTAPTLCVEASATNYTLQSTDFTNASWTKSNTTISGNTEAGPANDLTADKVVASATTSLHYVTQAYTLPGIGSYVYSVFLKAAEETTCQITLYQSSGSVTCTVDLSNGTLSHIVNVSPITNPNATITPYKNNWYRVSISGTTSMTTVNTSITLRGDGADTYLGNGTAGIYVWGAQLEAGTTPTSFIPTTTATVTRATDAYTGTGLVYSNIAEAGGINLLAYTEQLENTAWTKVNCNVSTNAVSAPGTAFKTVEVISKSGASGTFGHIYQTAYMGAGVNVGKTYAGSIWLWSDSGSQIVTLKISDIAYNTYTSSNITLTTTPTRYSFTSNGGGSWNASGTQIALGIDLTGASASVYAWGAQLEVSASMSDYVPNYTDEIEWVSGVDYPVGTIVTRSSTHKTYYRVATGTGSGFTLASPPESGDVLHWTEYGPTNKWSMFVLDRNTASIQPDMIQVLIRPGQRVDAIALSGLVADAVSITVHNASLGTLYTHTTKLSVRATQDWSDYFFGAFSAQKPSVVRFDLPPVTDCTIAVTILHRGGIAECAALVAGMSINLGTTQAQPVSESLNFSKIERDSFGNSILVPRRTIPKTSQTLFIRKDQVNSIRAARTSLNAKPAIWSGLDDESTHDYFESLLILGVYKEFTINMVYNDFATINLQLEEI